MFCSNCGNEVKNGEKFCSKCGQEVDKEKRINFKEKIKENKIPIIIFLALAIIIGGGLISNFLIENSAKPSKNINYYEKTGTFDSHADNTNNIIEKYNLTEDESKVLEELFNRAQEEIKENNIINADMYYKKNNGLGDRYIVIRGNNIYIMVDSDTIEVNKGSDKMLITEETIGEYYDDIFDKAKKDTEYKELIYFDNIEDLK